jgi:exosortase F-associated protein
VGREIAVLKGRPWRIAVIALSIAALAAIFILQQFDYFGLFCGCRASSQTHFIVNKTIRLILNDVFMLLIIKNWFDNTDTVKLALLIQIIDLFILLPIYFVLKLSFEGSSEISSPLLSQLHRLVVNPTLMVLLIAAIYLQRYVRPKR